MLSTRSPTHTRLLAGVLLLLWLSGCSHTLPREALPANLPEHIELSDTPFFAQQRYQCGPASLAMVLGQRGVAVTPGELVSRVYLPQREGSVAPEMIATARSYGMVVYELPPTMGALLREVAAGNPVLVLQNLGLSWLPKWHYAVVVGYELGAQQLILRSGVTERHTVSLALFDRTWVRGSRWGMVVLRPGDLPASGDALRYLKAAYALEQTGQLMAAVQAYRAGSGRWPEEPLAWLAESNMHYRLGRYGEAVETLRAALARHPEAAQIWNNLAYALAGMGCRGSALEAIACAIRLAPGEVGFRQSREEIAQMEIAPAAEACRPLSCPAVR